MQNMFEHTRTVMGTLRDGLSVFFIVAVRR